jgi:hypothetical protein
MGILASYVKCCIACSAPQLAWETFSSLRFAPKLTAAADSMVAKISKRFPNFNGVHLRLEADMQAAPLLYEPLGNAEVCKLGCGVHSLRLCTS